MRRNGILAASILIVLRAPVGAQIVEPAADGGRLHEEPVLRIGLVSSGESATLTSDGGLSLRLPDESAVFFDVPPGQDLRLSADPNGILARTGTISRYLPGLEIDVDAARPEARVHVNDRPYRGRIRARAVAAGGITVINIVPIEDYLLGVVPLEIGPRKPNEQAAVRAQAVAARTYALANVGARIELGFDLFATVDDQVYGGMSVESAEASAAVRESRGLVLVYDRRPIRAFYHSTCGTGTTQVDEVLDRPPAPYLRPVADVAPDGTAYSAISPRYEWEWTWSPDELNGRVRDRMAEYLGVSPDDVGPIDRVRVLRRTPTGRVLDLEIGGPGSTYVLNRLDIRMVFRNEEGRILFSTEFDVIDRVDGSVTFRGKGYGHGAGMCQWGAIGRARAGQGYEEILTAYYTDAAVVRAY